MTKYHSIAEIITDYRKKKDLSQLDLAILLDVDSRTVSRWEKGATLLNPEVKKCFVERLHIPHQVIHNLNSTFPISIYYDIDNMAYSLNAAGVKVPSAQWLKSEYPLEDDNVIGLTNATDVEKIEVIQELNGTKRLLPPQLLKESIKAIPELNFILKDQSGFYAGHLVVTKLRYEAYEKLREQKLQDVDIHSTDISTKYDTNPNVFFFYSHKADSLANAYYMMNRLFTFLKNKKFKEYVFVAIEESERNINLLKEMGLRQVWQNDKGQTFLEGNFDIFLNMNNA